MTRTPTPDAWLQLVLKTMSTDEIQQVLAKGEESDTNTIHLLRELLKRSIR